MEPRRIKRFPEIATPQAVPQPVQRVHPRQITSGAQRGQQTLSGPNVKINASEGNIIISDGTNNRIIIGYQENGF